MEGIDPQLAAVFAVTTATGFLMLLSGVHKHLLDWRHRGRHCPSCGRLIDGPVCRACTR